MGKVKIGVIGCGSIATHRHLPEYNGHKETEIIAVCDSVKTRAEDAAAKYGATAYTDFQEMLKNADVDAVSICTPNYLHASMTIAALEAGKHVLCEKPMATSREEAEKMVAAADKAGKKLMIAHNQRFVASHEKAKQLIESGAIGKIFSFRTAFGHSGPESWSVDGKDSWFFKKNEAFIGAMGDLGVHKADLLRYILGEEFVEVAAFIESGGKENSDVDDGATCILRTESGAIGTLAASWMYQKEDNSTVIYGEKAILRLEEDPEYSLIIHHPSGETTKQQLGSIQTNESSGQTDSRVVYYFINSILNDIAPPITGKDAMKSLEIILGAIESNETRKIIRL
jgi:UDP-N-acetylglucosamine 3-dehydrogenase